MARLGGGGLIGVVVSLDATVYVHWWPGWGGGGLIGVVVSLDATVYVHWWPGRGGGG